MAATVPNRQLTTRTGRRLLRMQTARGRTRVCQSEQTIEQFLEIGEIMRPVSLAMNLLKQTMEKAVKEATWNKTPRYLVLYLFILCTLAQTASAATSTGST